MRWKGRVQKASKETSTTSAQPQIAAGETPPSSDRRDRHNPRTTAQSQKTCIITSRIPPAQPASQNHWRYSLWAQCVYCH